MMVFIFNERKQDKFDHRSVIVELQYFGTHLRRQVCCYIDIEFLLLPIWKKNLNEETFPLTNA